MSGKLLFDQNLSRHLVSVVSLHFNGSAHVTEVGLDTASDRTIWDYAKGNGFTIISKDGDFHQLSLLYGAPPKTVWLRTGNSSTDDLAELLKSRLGMIATFISDEQAALLILERTTL